MAYYNPKTKQVEDVDIERLPEGWAATLINNIIWGDPKKVPPKDNNIHD